MTVIGEVRYGAINFMDDVITGCIKTLHCLHILVLCHRTWLHPSVPLDVPYALCGVPWCTCMITVPLYQWSLRYHGYHLNYTCSEWRTQVCHQLTCFSATTSVLHYYLYKMEEDANLHGNTLLIYSKPKYQVIVDTWARYSHTRVYYTYTNRRWWRREANHFMSYPLTGVMGKAGVLVIKGE